MLVCSTHLAREAAGAAGTRRFLRPLLSEGRSCKPRTHCAARMRIYVRRHCGHMWGNVIARSDLSAVAQRAKAEATKQSILSLRGEMDCFASLAMTVLD